MTPEHQVSIDQAEVDTAWQIYQYRTGRHDAEAFQQTYLGRYASREAFGQQLANGLGAGARLARLPDWLRAYLRIDGEAVLRDFEAAGHVWVHELPDNGGAYAFDGDGYAAVG